MLRELLKRQPGGDMKYVTYEENVKEWENFEGVNLLKLNYEDIGKYGSKFQLKAILDVMEQERQIRLNVLTENAIIFQERDLFSIEKVFIPLNEAKLDCIDVSLLKELIVLGKKMNDYDRIGRIFLKSSFEIAYARMAGRGREAEKILGYTEYATICQKMQALEDMADVVINCNEISSEAVATIIETVVLQKRVNPAKEV